MALGLSSKQGILVPRLHPLWQWYGQVALPTSTNPFPSSRERCSWPAKLARCCKWFQPTCQTTYQDMHNHDHGVLPVITVITHYEHVSCKSICTVFSTPVSPNGYSNPFVFSLGVVLRLRLAADRIGIVCVHAHFPYKHNLDKYMHLESRTTNM